MALIAELARALLGCTTTVANSGVISITPEMHLDMVLRAWIYTAWNRRSAWSITRISARCSAFAFSHFAREGD